MNIFAHTYPIARTMHLLMLALWKKLNFVLYNIIARGSIFSGTINVNVYDTSYPVPKPLIVAVEELGPVAKATVDVLREMGADNDIQYQGQHRVAAQRGVSGQQSVNTVLYNFSGIYSIIYRSSHDPFSYWGNLHHQQQVGVWWINSSSSKDYNYSTTCWY